MNVPQSRVVKNDSSGVGQVSLLSLLAAIGLGVLAAIIVAPGNVAQLAQTFIGANPKAYWYLSRGSAFVALGLLWLSMMLGLLITDKLARSWPGAATAFSVHEYVSLLGLGFVLLHAVILIGDRYIKYQLVQILMPFGSINYHPIWVGVGQIAFYVWALISASFYVRQWLGSKAWKIIHYVSFFNFLIAIIHGVASGTDTAMPWAQAVYWSLGGSVLFLTVFRIVASGLQPQPQGRPAPSATLPQPRQ